MVPFTECYRAWLIIKLPELYRIIQHSHLTSMKQAGGIKTTGPREPKAKYGIRSSQIKCIYPVKNCNYDEGRRTTRGRAYRICYIFYNGSTPICSSGIQKCSNLIIINDPNGRIFHERFVAEIEEYTTKRAEKKCGYYYKY